jgi:phosphomannomutase
MNPTEPALRAKLDYEPADLKFGTSGRRGRVADLTQLEVYVNAAAELDYLQSLSPSEGGIVPGDEFFFACDLRPSSTQIVPGERARGEIAQAIGQAILDAGMKPVFLGAIPTPALASYALSRAKGSIMVTGSHIPFDRNGYKTNTAAGELLKRDETPIQARVEQIRQRVYSQPALLSPFEPTGVGAGLFKNPRPALPPVDSRASAEFLRRYRDFFAGMDLRGLRLVVYQHSAVGRDLLVELLREFGAEIIPAGRSDTFVPIDTEAIDDAQFSAIQTLVAAAWAASGPVDAVVSTDGDSDRPLVLGIENSPTQPGKPGRARFFGGDLVGMVTAEYLQADAVVVPVSCNDAVDRGTLKDVVRPKTKIGSPYVIEGINQARAVGCRRICGWEANGGFLLGSDLTRDGRTLKALPTRDAFLPILACLFSAKAKGLPLTAVFDQLPARFSRAALLREFPRTASLKLLERFQLPAEVGEVRFGPEATTFLDRENGQKTPLSPHALERAGQIRLELEQFFPASLGFGRLVRINYTDGVRAFFSNGDIAHVRPSGNADELRIYAVADTQVRADEIARLGVAEPNGVLRSMQKSCGV